MVNALVLGALPLDVRRGSATPFRVKISCGYAAALLR
jgi:hypothetical protein